MSDQKEINRDDCSTKLSFVPEYHSVNDDGKWRLSKQLHVGKSAIQLNAALEEDRLIRLEGGEIEIPISPMDILPGSSPVFATYEDPIEFSFTASGLVRSGMKWDQAWLSRHKAGNRLPRGKVFQPHRHLERIAGSQGLGKLIVGSIKSALASPRVTVIDVEPAHRGVIDAVPELRAASGKVKST